MSSSLRRGNEGCVSICLKYTAIWVLRNFSRKSHKVYKFSDPQAKLSVCEMLIPCHHLDHSGLTLNVTIREDLFLSPCSRSSPQPAGHFLTHSSVFTFLQHLSHSLCYCLSPHHNISFQESRDLSYTRHFISRAMKQCLKHGRHPEMMDQWLSEWMLVLLNPYVHHSPFIHSC